MTDFSEMEQFRCPTCSKLLFKYRLRGNIEIQIKCTRCSSIATLIIDTQVKLRTND
jgi:phage FluMu protein Com